MVRVIISTLLVALTVATPTLAAETIVCSYRAYPVPGKGESSMPVVLRIHVGPTVALVTPQGVPLPAEQYHVLENNSVGVVLARSMSLVERTGTPASVGAFLIVIDRNAGRMTTDSVFVGDAGKARAGQCT